MKIGLYIEHGSGNGVGGAELLMAYLASALSADHSVDLVHHRTSWTRQRFAALSDDDLSRVNLRYVPREDEPPAFGNPLRRYAAARDWGRSLSEGYDAFVNCTHWLPTFCHAPVGLLIVLFPIYVRPDLGGEHSRLPAWKRARHAAYYGFEWSRRIATYRHRTAISEYSRRWAMRRWGLDCDVVYPPVDVAARRGAKEPLILSVGRFATAAHTKKQLEMVRAFQTLGAVLPDWSYASVGGLNDRAENQAYFERVRQEGAASRTIVAANLRREAVLDLFGRARIFWHATGFDDDTERRPELCEHFGISTVEAMAAGCVPVVVAKGGQPEIVEHGVSGFVWHTLEELKQYSRALADDPALWARMSEAARRRAATFSRERFLRAVLERLGLAVPRADEGTARTGGAGQRSSVTGPR